MTLSANIKRVFHGCENLGGIYTITCSVNGWLYIGSTNLFERRARNHYFDLRRNRHRNLVLQSDFNLYGVGSFIFEVVHVISDPMARSRAEKTWIRKVFGNGCYNATFSCGPMTHTPESRAKISEARTGTHHSPETLARMSASHKARFSPEQQAKRAATDQRRIDKAAVRETKRLAVEADRAARKIARAEALAAAQETRKIAQKAARALIPRKTGPKKGFRHTEETRAKMSRPRGKQKRPRVNRPWTTERKEAAAKRPLRGVVALAAGWHHTPETRAKMSASHKARAEHKA